MPRSISPTEARLRAIAAELDAIDLAQWARSARELSKSLKGCPSDHASGCELLRFAEFAEALSDARIELRRPIGA